MRSAVRRRAPLLRVEGVVLLLTLCSTGCSGLPKLYEDVEGLLAERSFNEAADLVESNSDLFDDDDRLLFNLELGGLLHLARRYAKSNDAFERAKAISERLFTKSVTDQTFSLFTNDTVIAYEGENFERALVHLFSALNYTLMGDPSGATVEARQVDALLAKIQTDSGARSVYKEDAFARYLSALLFDQRGRLEDAIVSYRQALRAYGDYERDYGTPRPPDLLPLALGAAERLGPVTRQRLAALYGDAPSRTLGSGEGAVAVLHYNGWVPRKQSSFFEISFGRAWVYVGDMQPRDADAANVDRALAGARAVAANTMLRVAFPTYVNVTHRIRRMTVSSGGGSARAQLVESIGRIARKSLDDRRSRILAKAAARAAFKYALAEGTCQVAYRTLEELPATIACATARAASALSEVADTRSWRTLPDEISLALLPLPEGSHDLRLEFSDRSGRIVETRTVEDVAVASGRRTFMFARTLQ